MPARSTNPPPSSTDAATPDPTPLPTAGASPPGLAHRGNSLTSGKVLLKKNYKVLNQLNFLYRTIPAQLDYRILVNDPTSTLNELSFGEYTMQSMADRGFGMPLRWVIIESFVKKLLEGTVPMTFMAHIAPPGSVV